jgi:hypothetical protein
MKAFCRAVEALPCGDPGGIGLFAQVAPSAGSTTRPGGDSGEAA